MSQLTEMLLDFAESTKQNSLRFITYGLCGVDEDGDWVSHAIQNTLRIVSPGKFGPAIQDHKAVSSALSGSTLNYTVFQTATMIDRPRGTPYVSGSPEECPGVRLWDRWGVLDAADVCLDSLGSKDLKRLQMRYLR